MASVEQLENAIKNTNSNIVSVATNINSNIVSVATNINSNIVSVADNLKNQIDLLETVDENTENIVNEVKQELHKLKVKQMTEVPLAYVEFTQDTLLALGYPFQNEYSLPYKFPTLTSTLKPLLGSGDDSFISSPLTFNISNMPKSSIQHSIVRSILGIEGLAYDKTVFPLWTRNCPIVGTAWKYGLGEICQQNSVFLHYAGPNNKNKEYNYKCNIDVPSDIDSFIPKVELETVPMPENKTHNNGLENITNANLNWYSKVKKGTTGLPGSKEGNYSEPSKQDPTPSAGNFKIPHTIAELDDLLDSDWMATGFNGPSGLTIATNLQNFRQGKYYQIGMSKSLINHQGFNACIRGLVNALDIERLLGNKISHYGPFPSMNMYRLLDDMLDKKSPDSITNAVLGLYNNLGKEKLEELYLDDSILIEWGLAQLYNDPELVPETGSSKILDELNVFDNLVKCTQEIHWDFTQYLIRGVLLKNGHIQNVDQFNMKILNYTPFAKTGVNTMLNDKTICRDASLSINELGPDESKRISNFDPWCDDLELSMKHHGYLAATSRPYAALASVAKLRVSDKAKYAPSGFFSANVACFNSLVQTGNLLKSKEMSGVLYQRYSDVDTPILDNDDMFNPTNDTQWKFTRSRLTYYPDPADETSGYKFFHVLSPSDFEDQINNNSFVTMTRS